MLYLLNVGNKTGINMKYKIKFKLFLEVLNNLFAKYVKLDNEIGDLHDEEENLKILIEECIVKREIAIEKKYIVEETMNNLRKLIKTKQNRN
jgi:hypothetical protein